MHLIELNSKPFIHLENVILFVTVIHEKKITLLILRNPLTPHHESWTEQPTLRTIVYRYYRTKD